MTNEAFEKWLKENYLVDMSEFIADEQERTYIKENNLLRKAWQAGKADSAERDKLVTELQATINDLREALECIDRDYGTIGIHSIVTSTLAKTPAQSLQKHDNATIEKCAKVCENIITGDDAEFYTDAFAKAIRKLKG